MLSANFKIFHLLYKGLTDGPGVESPGLQEVEVLGQKHFSEKCTKYLWVSIFPTGPPPDYALCYFIYIFFLMAARKMSSFNEQHKNLSLQKIFYLNCVCIFSLSYLGWGGGVIKYKSMGKMYQIFHQYSHYFWICVCSGLIKLVPSFIQVLYVKIWMFLCVDTCMKALLSHVIISNKCLYKVSIIYCFPLAYKNGKFL